MDWRVEHGDCLDLLRAMPDCSVDSICCDPPYGLSFMGKRWDYDVPSVEVWAECLRVLKPGGHLLAFAGTRTQHRMAVRIEDAGFEIRDLIMWCYGSGFPKSLDVGKAMDKAAGAVREVIGPSRANIRADLKYGGNDPAHNHGRYGAVTHPPITAPATELARQWQGWGTALKPALEPITMARKPFPGTVAANVAEWGTGAINVDGCRVDGKPRGTHGDKTFAGRAEPKNGWGMALQKRSIPAGRWPANLIHDGSEEVLAGFPDANGSKPGSFQRVKTSKGLPGGGYGQERADMRAKTEIAKPGYEDSGSAARFFYCPKASKADREDDNPHPTVKPTDLMRYLCRLVTPPGGTVLDPFCGSGSTGKAAMLEGLNFIGFEREAEYVEIARRRIAEAAARPMLEGIK